MKWRKGNEEGCLYILNKNDLSRIGSSWMKGRLKIGDIVMSLKHSGDCFDDYILIHRYHNGLRAIPGSEFGAYSMGEKLKWKPTKREFHMLMAGEDVRNGVERHKLSEEIEQRALNV